MHHGNAARTGRAWQHHEPAPQDTVGSTLRITAIAGGNPCAGAQPPAARARHQGTAFFRAPADREGRHCSSNALQRNSLSRPLRTGCPGCGKHRRIRACLSSRTRKNKTPPDAASEGVRASSEDRGRRSPVGGKISRWWPAAPCDRRDSGDTRMRTRVSRGFRAAVRTRWRCRGDGSWTYRGVACRGCDEGRGQYARACSRATSAQCVLRVFPTDGCLHRHARRCPLASLAITTRVASAGELPEGRSGSSRSGGRARQSSSGNDWWVCA